MLHRTLLSIVILGGLSATLVRGQTSSLEYDLKAAFLLNFARFVEWPQARRDQPFNLCTLQPDPFGRRLETTVGGETWEGRPISVRRLPTLRDADCHLLYVPARAMAEFRARRQVVDGQPVLLVGEDNAFLRTGGMIHLFLESNQVRFSVSQDSAEAAGLHISSRLLRLAKDVLPSPKGVL